MGKLLQLETLQRLIKDGRIDTVLVVFPDHLGRLIGKRVTGVFFLEEIVPSGMHACDYLLAADMEMEPLPGMEMTSWEKGYGDFHAVADMDTLRLIPWLEGTALVMSDLEWGHNSPVTQSPRAILKRQIERARQAGIISMMGSELEFYLFDETQEEISGRNFYAPKPASGYIIDYHILQTSRDEPIIREIRNQMSAAGIPVEFSKGEWGKGQHEINLVYADTLEMADRHVIYKNGVKEIASAQNRAVTFMAKYDERAAGSSFHLHTSIFDKTGKRNLFWDNKKKKESATFRQFLGGLLHYCRELFLLFAPTVNSYKRYQAASFAPTRIAWAYDNRTTGFRVIGNGQSFRIENRMPGADANPYLAFAATLAAGLAGIEEGLDCGDPFTGDAYRSQDIPRVPSSLQRATDLFRESRLAEKAFGADVVKHYARMAELEQKSFEASVTDWERRRYFERI